MELERKLLEHVTAQLHEYTGRSVVINQCDNVTGGSINDAFELKTSAGQFFLKTNAADRHPSMFAAEADGLQLLSATKSVRIPEVIGQGETDDTTWLLLEFIGDSKPTTAFWHRFGAGLAGLHSASHAQFGSDHNNYIGTLDQVNTQEKEWSAFFMQHRLEPLVKLARDKKKVESGMAFRFERLYGKLHDLFPKEAPALLHGDLWHGNFICDADGRPALFDPAVYYGHREMDIAMLHLFGDAEPEFLASYNAERPLEKGWEERVDLCNLYPLLVHVNLFGGHYVLEVEKALKRWV